MPNRMGRHGQLKGNTALLDAPFKWIHVLGLTGAMFLWGSSFVALKLAIQGYDPMVVIFLRMLVATLCFIPFLPSYRRVYSAGPT